MSAHLIITSHAEQRELAQQRAAVAELEAALAPREAEFAKLKAELRSFERRYLKIVGTRYDELAGIERQIAELQGLNPDEANEQTASLADDEVGCGQNRFHTEKLKKLYREVCRKFHPDLSADDEEREHRHQLMIEVNRAYETGSEDRLQSLLEAGARNAEAGGTDSATELIALARRIAQASERLLAMAEEIAEVTASETWRLKLRVGNAEAMGADLFADLVAQVDRQIFKARNRLTALQSIMITA